MMLWSEPLTNSQLEYYRKHASERGLYSWFLFVILFTWAIVDFFGFKMLLTDGFETIDSVSVSKLTSILTSIILIAFHYGLYITTTTFYYDKLDEDTNTDSSIIIPVILTVFMLFASREGSKKILTHLGHKAEIKTSVQADTYRADKIKQESDAYAVNVQAVKSNYSDQLLAIEVPAKSEIDQLNRKLWETPEKNRSPIRKKIREIEKQKQSKVEELMSKQSEELKILLNNFNKHINIINGLYKRELKHIDTFNEGEKKKEETSIKIAKKYSWIVSLILAALFWLIAYRKCRIDVLSGIVPIYEFTELDRRGGIFTWFLTAFLDAFRRQAFRTAVGLHRLLSTGTANVKGFDSSFIYKEGTYNKESISPHSNGNMGKLPPRQTTTEN
jgi:hypothetical protein